MKKHLVKVGMREFRAHLLKYLMTSLPVAITRHGETIGFYIPARQQTNKNEIDALKIAALNLEKLLFANNITEDDLFSDFKTLREKDTKK